MATKVAPVVLGPNDYVLWVLKVWKERIMELYWASGKVNAYYDKWKKARQSISGNEGFNKMMFVSDYHKGKGEISTVAFLQIIVDTPKYESWLRVNGQMPEDTNMEEQQLTIEGDEVPVSATLPPKAKPPQPETRDNGVVMEDFDPENPRTKAQLAKDHAPVKKAAAPAKVVDIKGYGSTGIGNEPPKVVPPKRSHHKKPVAPPPEPEAEEETFDQEAYEDHVNDTYDKVAGPLDDAEEAEAFNSAHEPNQPYQENPEDSDDIPPFEDDWDNGATGFVPEEDETIDEIEEAFNSKPGDEFPTDQHWEEDQNVGYSPSHTPIPGTVEVLTPGFHFDELSGVVTTVGADLVLKIPANLSADQDELWLYLKLFLKALLDVSATKNASKAEHDRAVGKAKKMSLSLSTALLEGRKSNFQ